MKQNWEKIKVSTKSLYKSYDKKYGVFSDYSSSQDLFFSDRYIKKNIIKAFENIDLNNKKMLVLGINNGREIVEINKLLPNKDWGTLKITGIDLSRSALNVARKILSKFNIKLLFGDVKKFRGINIGTNKEEKIEKNSQDIFFACTSLQSSNIFSRSDFTKYLTKITNLLKRQSAFIAIVPDTTINSGRYKKGGVFIPKDNKQDNNYAKSFVKITSRYLKKSGFKVKIFGEKFIFVVGKRGL